jgi:hypothetical protein
MICRAASRSARSVRPVDKPPLLRSATKPSPATDPDAELRNRVDHHVERHNKAGQLYSRLAAEFNDLRNKAESVVEALQDAVESSGKELGTRVTWLMEQRLLLVESNERLQEKIQELRYGLKSLSDVNHLVEKFRTLEKTSVLLGEHVDVLQQGVVAVCMEFKRMFAIESDEASQIEAHEEPATMFESCIKSCDDSLDDSLTDCPAFGPVNSSTESQPERLQPDPVETSAAVKPLVASPEEPVVEVAVQPAVEVPEESVVESCVDSPIGLPVLDSESPAVHDGAPSSVSAMPAPLIPMSSCQPDRLRPEPVPPALELTPELSLSPGLPSHGSDLPAEESRCDDTCDDPVTVESPNNPAIEIVPNLRPTDLRDFRPPDVRYLGSPDPVSSSRPAFCQFVIPRNYVYCRLRYCSRRRLRRLRSCRHRLPARNPPGGNSRRLPRRRQQKQKQKQKPPNKTFHCFGRLPARKLPPQSPVSEKYSLAPTSAQSIGPPVHRSPSWSTHVTVVCDTCRLRFVPASLYPRIPVPIPVSPSLAPVLDSHPSDLPDLVYLDISARSSFPLLSPGMTLSMSQPVFPVPPLTAFKFISCPPQRP